MRRRKQRTMQVENGPTLFPTHNKARKRQSFHTQIYRIHSSDARPTPRTMERQTQTPASSLLHPTEANVQRDTDQQKSPVGKAAHSIREARGKDAQQLEAGPRRGRARPTLGGATPKTGYHWPPGSYSGQSAWSQARRHHPLRARDA